jgi:hypothetical protein
MKGIRSARGIGAEFSHREVKSPTSRQRREKWHSQPSIREVIRARMDSRLDPFL